MVNLNINIKKKDLFIIIAAFVFLVGTGIIIAYGGTTPAAVGHSLGEIDASSCTDGQVMIKVGGVWGCGANPATVIIGPGEGHDDQTGTQACQSIGKKCVVVMSYNFINTDPGCYTSMQQYNICHHKCANLYNQLSSYGVPNTPAGSTDDNLHSCNARVGTYRTYLQDNVVDCFGRFSVICS